jgi:hypothetical protein
VRVEEANAVDLSIQISLFIEVPRPGLTEVTIRNFSEGGDGVLAGGGLAIKTTDLLPRQRLQRGRALFDLLLRLGWEWCLRGRGWRG